MQAEPRGGVAGNRGQACAPSPWCSGVCEGAESTATTLSPGQIQGRGLGVQLRGPQAGAQEVASPPGGLRDP